MPFAAGLSRADPAGTDDLIIVVPVWLLWLTMPALGYATGLLLWRSRVRDWHWGWRVAVGAIAGGAACVLAELLPSAIACAAHRVPVGLLNPLFLTTLGVGATAPGLLLPQFRKGRTGPVQVVLAAVLMGYLGGLLASRLPVGPYTNIWWLERYFLFGAAVALARRPGK